MCQRRAPTSGYTRQNYQLRIYYAFLIEMPNGLFGRLPASGYRRSSRRQPVATLCALSPSAVPSQQGNGRLSALQNARSGPVGTLRASGCRQPRVGRVTRRLIRGDSAVCGSYWPRGRLCCLFPMPPSCLHSNLARRAHRSRYPPSGDVVLGRKTFYLYYGCINISKLYHLFAEPVRPSRTGKRSGTRSPYVAPDHASIAPDSGPTATRPNRLR